MSQKAVTKIEERIAFAEVFDVDPETGLNESQVELRKKEGLENKTPKHVTKTYWQIICDNLFSVLNIILFIIFGLMLSAGLGVTHYVFMAILVCNIGIGLYQDINARRLCDKLRVITDPKAKVIRNGKVVTIDTNQVVLSDILVLDSGDQICADAVIVKGMASIDESVITGESLPVSKESGENIYSGTFLTKGHVYAKVVKVAAANYAETLQKAASGFSRPNSEIKSSISRMIWFCCIASVTFGVLMTIIYLFRFAGWNSYEQYSSFIASLSGSLVAMIPAGMSLLTSLALAVGVIQLAKKRMLVQQLYCIEMLARVDVLCLDKTGTLTDGSMVLAKTITFSGYTEKEIASMVATVLHFTNDTNATANALRNAFGNETKERQSFVLPFDSASKYSAVSVLNNGTYFFGAYGFVPAKGNPEVKSLVEEYASKGYRCLVVAKSNKRIEKKKVPDNGEIVALLLLSDHIKEDAAENIEWFKSNGVQVKVISGDDPVTVAEIAKRVGVPNANKFVSLEGKSLEETAVLANEYSVFGRVSPEQKAVIVSTYRKKGHKVAMTGDGVNDILALKVADCSIAMASGSEAARNVAHLVALDSDFSKLPDVVAQGRRVINNLQRTCSLFLVKTFFAITVSLIFLFSDLFGGLRYPFETPNLLVWETFSIGGAAFFLALQPSKERLTGGFFSNIMKKVVPGGIAAVVGGLLPYLLMLIWPESYSMAGLDLSQYPLLTRTVSVIVFTLVSYVVLFRVCWPFTTYRALVFVLMAAAGSVTFGIDYFVAHGNILALSWDGLSPYFFLVVLVIGLIAVGVYIGVELLIKRLTKKEKTEIVI